MAALVTDQRVMNSDTEESRKYLLWLTTLKVLMNLFGNIWFLVVMMENYIFAIRMAGSFL